MGKLFRHLALFLTCLAFAFVVVGIASSRNVAAPDGSLSMSFAGAQSFWMSVSHVIEFPAGLLNLPQNVPGFVMLMGIWAALLHGCCYTAFVCLRRTFRDPASRIPPVAGNG